MTSRSSGCDVIEVVDQPNVGPADENHDCSGTSTEKDPGLVRVVGDALSR